MPAKREYNVKGTNDFLILAAIFFFLCLWAVKDAWFPSEKVLKKHPLQVVAAFEVSGTVKHVNVDEGDSVGEGQVLAVLRSDYAVVQYDKAKDAYGQAKEVHYQLQKDLKKLQDEGASAEDVAKVQSDVEASQLEMDRILAEVEDLRLQIDSDELKSPTKGVIQKVFITPHTMTKSVVADFDGVVGEVSTNLIVLAASSGQEKEYSINNAWKTMVQSGDQVSAGDMLASHGAFAIDPKDHFYLFNKSLTVLSFILFWAFLAIHILAR